MREAPHDELSKWPTSTENKRAHAQHWNEMEWVIETPIHREIKTALMTIKSEHRKRKKLYKKQISPSSTTASAKEEQNDENLVSKVNYPSRSLVRFICHSIAKHMEASATSNRSKPTNLINGNERVNGKSDEKNEREKPIQK